MGIFSYNLRSILEVKRKVNGQEEDLDNEEQDEENDEPGQEENNENDKPNEYSMGNVGDDNPEDNNDESNQEEQQPEENNEGEDSTGDDTSNETDSDDAEGEDSEANDYTMDVEDDESGDGASDEGDSTDTDGEESTGDETEGSENELKSLEDDIFKDIPPEQMNIKIMELKKQYLEVYATITDVLTRTNKIPKTTQIMSVLEFIINKLMELKEMVQFYLSNTFDTKTYVENMVNYQQYLATLNTINRLLKEISRKKENNT